MCICNVRCNAKAQGKIDILHPVKCCSCSSTAFKQTRIYKFGTLTYDTDIFAFLWTKQIGKGDIMSRFMVQSEKDQMKMNDQYLRDIILNFIIAGKDTSANTLTWFFYMLCKHPLVQEKVAGEVRGATQATQDENEISTYEFAQKITEEALEKMQYLHAALTETLRLYPAVPVVIFLIA